MCSKFVGSLESSKWFDDEEEGWFCDKGFCFLKVVDCGRIGI